MPCYGCFRGLRRRTIVNVIYVLLTLLGGWVSFRSHFQYVKMSDVESISTEEFSTLIPLWSFSPNILFAGTDHSCAGCFGADSYASGDAAHCGEGGCGRDAFRGEPCVRYQLSQGSNGSCILPFKCITSEVDEEKEEEPIAEVTVVDPLEGTAICPVCVIVGTTPLYTLGLDENAINWDELGTFPFLIKDCGGHSPCCEDSETDEAEEMDEVDDTAIDV